MSLAEIPYPRIDPDLLPLGPVTVRWYGVSYVLAFVAAFFVLRGLARRRRWPVPPDRVADVLFWGILGVFVGGRLGWVLFYGVWMGDFDLRRVFNVWEGGMSFHGGLLGVVLAYWVYTGRSGKPRGDFFDGLTLATPLGIFFVRLANFVNGELYGRVWDGPWAMRFPRYQEVGGPARWEELRDAGRTADLWTPHAHHPSQLYEALGEGLLMFFVLRWLMLGRGVGGGRIAAAFLAGYGAFRFLVEFFRLPDKPLGTPYLGLLTQGQVLSLGMVVAGAVVYALCGRRARRETGA